MGYPDQAKQRLLTNWLKIGATHLPTWFANNFNWDFSDEGRLRQTKRMAELASKANTQYVIMDFVFYQEYRSLVKPDIVVFMDTIELGRYADTNKVFEAPNPTEVIDYRMKRKD